MVCLMGLFGKRVEFWLGFNFRFQFEFWRIGFECAQIASLLPGVSLEGNP